MRCQALARHRPAGTCKFLGSMRQILYLQTFNAIAHLSVISPIPWRFTPHKTCQLLPWEAHRFRKRRQHGPGVEREKRTAPADYSGHTAPVRAVEWSPDGTRLASASQDGTVLVWNATTRHLLMSYLVQSSTAYADGTLSVSWSPDGKHLASGGVETMVHLWNAPSCKR